MALVGTLRTFGAPAPLTSALGLFKERPVFGPNMSTAQYNQLSKVQKLVYWCLILAAVVATGYVWFA